MSHVDIAILKKRFGEEMDLTEFVGHGIYNRAVRRIAQQLGRGADAKELVWRVLCWQAEHVRYPWDSRLPSWLLLICDMHVLLRHPVPRYWKLSINIFDFWKLPWETIRDGVGDCEDKTFLGTSVLRWWAVDAWAVLGLVKIGNVYYGHAWSEVHVDNEGFVIEWTLDPESLRRIGKDRYFEVAKTENLYNRIYYPMLKFNETRVIRVAQVREIRKKLGKKVRDLRRTWLELAQQSTSSESASARSTNMST